MRLCQRTFHAPTFVFSLIAFVAKATLAAEIPLGTVIMQLRSTVPTNATELNERVEDVTAKYLSEYFEAYYTRTEKLSSDYFSEVNLSTNSFGVHGVEGSFITTIEIGGTLVFNSDKLPSNFFIDTLLRNAFKGRNERLYLDQLLAKEDDEFLQNLTYLIIDINKGGVPEPPIREKSSSSSSSDNGTASGNNGETRGTEKSIFRTKWFTVVMYIISVVFALAVMSCGCFIYRRCQKRKGNGMKRDDSSKEPMKVIELPVKKKQLSSLRFNINKENTNENSDRISPTSTGTAGTSPGSIADKMDRPPPSPQRSMTSQASSIFTYTDNMSRFTTNNTVFSKSPSLSSKFSLDVPSIDLSIWRGGRQDPPAFGSDISVIENHKDLSLIPEEEDDIESGAKKKRPTDCRRNSSSNRYLSRKSRVALDVRHSKSRLSNRSETYFYNGNQASNDDSDGDSTGDVICDLKDLSMQIERKRSGIRSNQ